MSVPAVSWVLRDGGGGAVPVPSNRHVGAAVVRMVLVVLAEHANERGCDACPSQTLVSPPGPGARPAVVELVAGLLEINALHRLRSAQGVVGLAERYDAGRVNAACRRALDIGDPTYRTVKGILAAGTETDDQPAATAPTAPAHLHGPLRLFNLDEAAG